MPMPGGISQPGTRIVKTESEGSETKAGLADALWFGLAGDGVMLCLLVIVALGGWWSVAPLVVIAAELAVLFGMWFLSIPRYFVAQVPWLRVTLRPLSVRYAPLSFACSREIVCKMTFLTSVAAGVIWGHSIWNWLTAYGAVGDLIKSSLAVYLLPTYVYISGAVWLLVSVWRRSLKQGIALLVIAALGYGGWAMGTSYQVAASWAAVVARARIIAIPFVVPWIGSAVMIMLMTAKNILFPYLDFNLKPIGLDEVRETGLVGLWFPKLLAGPAKEPLPDRFIKVEVNERNGKTRKFADLSGAPEMTEFCKAVYHGKPFSLREARAVGLSRAAFEKLRDTFLDRGWACWANSKAKRQGVDLLAAGRKVVENIALGVSVES